MSHFGLLIVDKPVGPTSHQVVSVVRRGSGVRKVGHAGTLDPRASGVLVLCLGAATRLSEYLSTASKRYQAVIRFGSSTKTYDSEGEILLQTGDSPDRNSIEELLPSFEGEISQVPPPFSAIKIQGTKAYELAREGKEVKLDPRQVTIYDLKFRSYNPPDLSLEIECSAGTYIRSIAHDLGEKLSTGAHLAGLRRIKSGPFTIEEAIPLPKLEVGFMVDKWEKYLIPAVDALPELPIVNVSEDDLGHIQHGHRIVAEPGSTGIARAVSFGGKFVAILEAVEDGTKWHPKKVFTG